MSQPIAGIFMRGTVYDWYVIPFLVAFVLATFAAHYWRFFVRWLGGIRGRDWTAVSAVIDVVSIVQQTVQSDHGEHVIGYLATLTYFYRKPDLQMGEYSRMFDEETGAQAWTASYKSCAVMVHVNPRDPSHSVLRREEL